MTRAGNTRSYLDWNASAPLCAQARTAVLAALELVGNPSSVHREGRAARAIVEEARREVAALAAADPADVTFTSGGTEGANWVLQGGWDAVVSAGIEHAAVLAPIEASGARHVALAVGTDGLVSLDSIERALAAVGPAQTRTLLCLQAANNETGIIQPVAEAARLASNWRIPVLCDAVQAAGRMVLPRADALVLSAHKIGGPKGVGAVVTRGDLRLPALLHGGGQERRRRAGTENVAAIAGFGAATRAARVALSEITAQRILRDRLEAGVRAITPEAVIIGAGVTRLANTSCIALAGASAETLVIALDLAGIAVSAGAACSSGKVARSHVLDAMGLDPRLTRSAIRVSLGASTTAAEIDAFLEAWRQVAARPALSGAA